MQICVRLSSPNYLNLCVLHVRTFIRVISAKILVVKLSSLKLYIPAYLRKILIIGNCCHISGKNIITNKFRRAALHILCDVW